MKIEGSLAVAELMKKHVDEFLPFVMAMQEESTLRLRLTALSVIQMAGQQASEDQISQLKVLCKIYNISLDEIPKTCETLIGFITTDMIAGVQKTAKVQIVTTPFFLERSLVEAYYMLKAYIYEEARKSHTKPAMNFNFEDLKTLINDEELAGFARHSMERMKAATEPETPSLEMPSEEDIKKKLTNDLTKSSL
jgi:hypothetical protein